jgi:hypothetical protein
LLDGAVVDGEGNGAAGQGGIDVLKSKFALAPHPCNGSRLPGGALLLGEQRSPRAAVRHLAAARRLHRPTRNRSRTRRRRRISLEVEQGQKERRRAAGR